MKIIPEDIKDNLTCESIASYFQQKRFKVGDDGHSDFEYFHALKDCIEQHALNVAIEVHQSCKEALPDHQVICLERVNIPNHVT